MRSWRILGTIGCLLVTAAHGWTQSATLAEKVAVGDCFENNLEMKLTGTMRIQKQDDPITLKMEASGSHQLHECIMHVGPTGLPEKSARIYDKAEAVITVDKDRVEKSLRPERKLIVAHRQRDGLVAYCPTGPL